ncbi:MAG: hypothetical protein MJH11_16495 [Lentisphaeria bacterium]|nr:hypothetical protein [Lentisphaeria bacterium]
MWSIRRESESFVVEVRSSGTWELVSQVSISDSYFADGGAEFRPEGAGNTAFIGVYSGQSEQENYLCRFDSGTLSAQCISSMDGDQFVFASGENLITLDHGNCQVARFDGSGKCTSKIVWPDYSEDGAEDERPGYYACYLDDHHFLAGSSEGRLFVLGLDPLRIAIEVTIEGFEPVPLAERYPTLSEIEGFGSDLRYFGRCGGDIYFFFAKSHQSETHQLAIVPVLDLLNYSKKSEPDDAP